MSESKMHMLPVLFAFLLFFALGGPALAAGLYVEGEAMVSLKNNTGAALTEAGVASAAIREYINDVADGAGATAAHIYVTLSAELDEIFVLMTSDDQTTDELIAKLNENPNVISADPNYVFDMNGASGDAGQDTTHSTEESSAPAEENF